MELRTYGTRNVFLAQPGRYHEQLAATAMTPQQAEEFATVVNRAIRDTDFDPIDLAQLASGWTWPEPMSTAPLGIEDSEFLVEVARMLHRLWQEVGEQWSGVWAYDIADPLGGWLSRNGINHETADGVARAEQQARAWIAEGIEDSEFLVEVARMLHRLWQEVGEQWSGVWAYDIADPLGGWLSRNGINHETADGVARAEQQARAWIAEGMGAAR
jgi:hypothetical protein